MVLPANISRRAEIAVTASRLTPELVRRALTEDVTAITAKQAQVLAQELAPIAQEANSYLQMAVNHHGHEWLNTAEAVLWAIGDLSHFRARASAVAEW